MKGENVHNKSREVKGNLLTICFCNSITSYYDTWEYVYDYTKISKLFVILDLKCLLLFIFPYDSLFCEFL